MNYEETSAINYYTPQNHNSNNYLEIHRDKIPNIDHTVGEGGREKEKERERKKDNVCTYRFER